MDVARSLADLVSVDAAVVREGKVVYPNTALSKRAWEERGWRETSGRKFWELFDGEQAEQVMEWYKEFRSRDDRFGLLVLRNPAEDAPPATETLYAIRLEESDLVLIRPEGAEPIMERFSEMEDMNRMFRRYLEEGGVGFVILQDSDGRKGVIKYVTPEGAAILDSEVQELLGKEIESILAPEERSAAMARYRDRMAGRSVEPNQEYRFQSRTGTPIIIDALVGSTTWQGEPAVFTFFQDATARNLTLEELRRFAQGFDMLKDTVVLADKNFDILYVNPTGLERSGYTFEEVIGKPATIFGSTQDQGLDPSELASVLFEKGHWMGERIASTKDGRMYPVELSVSLAKDPQGDPEMVTVLSRDISERKEAERSILRARERAEFFTDLMAHDINNYIQGVIGFLELLGKDGLDGEKRHNAEQALEQATRISELIDRVRTISKAQHADRLEPVDLKAVVDEVVADMEQRYAPRPHRIEVSGDAGPIMVNADELLKDLVLNLLDNAIKHSSQEEAHVEVSVQRLPGEGGGRVRLEVTDRGPGIPDEEKGRVFYRFVRGVKGSAIGGLGLSLVLALTERYEGQVWIEDRVRGSPGEGTRVIVELPPA